MLVWFNQGVGNDVGTKNKDMQDGRYAHDVRDYRKADDVNVQQFSKEKK